MTDRGRSFSRNGSDNRSQSVDSSQSRADKLKKFERERARTLWLRENDPTRRTSKPPDSIYTFRSAESSDALKQTRRSSDDIDLLSEPKMEESRQSEKILSIKDQQALHAITQRLYTISQECNVYRQALRAQHGMQGYNDLLLQHQQERNLPADEGFTTDDETFGIERNYTLKVLRRHKQEEYQWLNNNNRQDAVKQFNNYETILKDLEHQIYGLTRPIETTIKEEQDMINRHEQERGTIVQDELRRARITSTEYDEARHQNINEEYKNILKWYEE